MPTGNLKNKIRSYSLYCITIIVYYDYTTKAQYNYDIFKTGFLEECDKEENVAVTGAATTSCLKISLYNVLSNVTYSPSHRQVGTPMTKIQSTLRTATDLCKNVSLAVLFGSNGNSYTVSKQSYMCVYIYTYTSQYRDAGRAKEIKKERGSSECRVSRIPFRVPYVRQPYPTLTYRLAKIRLR